MYVLKSSEKCCKFFRILQLYLYILYKGKVGFENSISFRICPKL